MKKDSTGNNCGGGGAASVVLKKMEAGSAVPKDLMNSPLWKNMPEDARAGLQNIAGTAELKQDFSKKLDTVKKQGLDALIANYNKLNAGALKIADRVPTAGTDLNKAIADKAGASLENTMKQKGTEDARAAKEKILASLCSNEAAKKAVEDRFKAVEQNYLKEKALNELKKIKSAEDKEEQRRKKDALMEQLLGEMME